MSDAASPDHRARPASALSRRRLFAVAGLSAAVLYVVAFAQAYRPYVLDDAYIGFRYVANLLGGDGFTFDGRTAVEGVSNAAWLLFMTPLAALTGPVAAAKILAPALILATLALIATVCGRRLASADGANSPIALAVAWLLLTLTSSDFLVFSLLGMETPLLALVLVAMLLLAASDRPLTLGALGALASAVHPSAALVAPLYMLIALATGSAKRAHLLRMLAAFAAVLLAITALRWTMWGALAPNTFHAKPLASPWHLLGRLPGLFSGELVNAPGVLANPFALAAMALGYLFLRRLDARIADFAAAATLAGFVFGLYAAPDWTQQARYFGPYAPMAALLAAAGAWQVARLVAQGSDRPRAGTAAFWAIVAAMALTGIVRTAAPLTNSFHDKYPGYVIRANTLIQPSLWMRDHLPPGAVIATRRIGALAYFSGHPVFDYTFGLTEPQVARRIRAAGHQFDDPHDEALRDVWLARAPDYILEDDQIIDRIAAAGGGAREGFRIHGVEYRVIRQFDIAANVRWTLAARVTPQP